MDDSGAVPRKNEEGDGPREVEFPSGASTCRAWLFGRPEAGGEPRPCIVMGHGFGGTRDAGLEPFARRFAEVGFAVLVFDYRHFGASDGEPRQLFSVRRQLEDWASAIAFARSLSGVDPDRLALWGTSYSGGHVIAAAARDGRIAAITAQGPMVDVWAALGRYIRYAGLGSFLRLGTRGFFDLLRGALGLRPVYVPIVAPPGKLAIMSTPDAQPGYRAIAPPHWRNEVTARCALTMLGYRPVASIGRVRCPALIQVCLQDQVLPIAGAIAAAKKMGPLGELKEYDCGHFDIYRGEPFESAADDQVAFYQRVLLDGD